MKKQTLIYLAIAAAAGYYFYFSKKKKKGIVTMEPLEKIPEYSTDVSYGGGQLATIPEHKLLQIPAVQKTLENIKGKIFAQAKKTVAKVQAKAKSKVKAKPTPKRKKLGELGATYL